MPSDHAEPERKAYALLDEIMRTLRKEEKQGGSPFVEVKGAIRLAMSLGRESDSDWLKDLLQAKGQSIPTAGGLNEEHPPYDRQAVLAYVEDLSSTDPHIKRALDGDFQTALQNTITALSFRDVLVTNSLRHDCAESLRALRATKASPETKVDVSIVCATEFARTSRHAELEEVLREFHASEPTVTDKVNLAFGLLGRVPWVGYPFSDY